LYWHNGIENPQFSYWFPVLHISLLLLLLLFFFFFFFFALFLFSVTSHIKLPQETIRT